mgnify:CR=1 FL=1
MRRDTAIKILEFRPVEFGHLLGFTKLTELHNGWIIHMISDKKDETLQGHRGSYKTTCVSIAIAILMVLHPEYRIAFIRKTDDDVKEIIKQVKKILTSQQMALFTEAIYGIPVQLTEDNAVALTTNLTDDIKGTSQLTGFGTGSSVTGKHFDIIFTDDIVNLKDRASRAERERTKLFYQELKNLLNRGGWIKNSGTPWHKDDAFSMMPPPQRFDCYSTGLISPEELEDIRSSMTRSLFAANYELRHVAAEDVLFTEPAKNADPAKAEQGLCHVDAAYGGEDYTAFTIMKRDNGKYYIFGKLWHKHVDDCLSDIIRLREMFLCGKIHMEDNGDKGYLAKDLKRRGERVAPYHESMNKYLKISTYLKKIWKDAVFVEGTDDEYIDQICDYNENAEHDDAPDSCASLARLLWRKGESTYKPLLYG